MDVTSPTQPHGGKSKCTTCAIDRDDSAYMTVERVLRLSTESIRSVPTELRKRKKIFLLKRFKGTLYYFSIYRSVKHSQVYPPPPPNLKAIHNDQEYSLLFYHLNNVTDFKKFDTGFVLPKSMEHFLHFLKIMKSVRHFSESPQIHGNQPWT